MAKLFDMKQILLKMQVKNESILPELKVFKLSIKRSAGKELIEIMYRRTQIMYTKFTHKFEFT